MDATERFAELLAGPPELIPLDEAALLVAAHARPGLDVPAELARLDDLAAGCAAPTLDALLAHLFVDLGFAGNRARYQDPRNSLLDQVITRRLGIPITLAIVTITVGRRIGVPLVGVGMPGHFLVRDQVDQDLFIDPFAFGARLDEAGCRRAFGSVHGHDAAFHPTFLRPVDPPAIIGRVLANLRGVYLAAGARAELLWVLQLRSLVPGTPSEERAELAALLLAAGRFGDAGAQYDRLAGEIGGDAGTAYARRAEQARARLN